MLVSGRRAVSIAVWIWCAALGPSRPLMLTLQQQEATVFCINVYLLCRFSLYGICHGIGFLQNRLPYRRREKSLLLEITTVTRDIQFNLKQWRNEMTYIPILVISHSPI